MQVNPPSAGAASANLPALTAEAIAAIGKDDPGADWQLEPQSHAKHFPDQQKTGPLIRILNQPAIAAIVDQFCKADTEAGKAQKKYKLWGRLGIYATMSATLVGAVSFLPFREALGLPEVKGGVFVLQYLALALTFIASRILAGRRYYFNWQENRGEAESARVHFFNAIMDADVSTDADADTGAMPPLPLKLEYFRRYQHDMQRRYYRERGEQQARGARRSKLWRWFSNLVYFALALIAVPTGLIVLDAMGWVSMPIIVEYLLELPFVAAASKVAEQSMLAVGIMASAVYAANEARSRLDMDEHNAARYKVTSRNLDYLSQGPLSVARQAAVTGDAPAVKRFVEQVQNQISAEHSQWRFLGKIMGPGKDRDDEATEI